MAQEGLQRNNGSPRGMGQPGRRGRNMRQAMLRPEDEQMLGSPEVQDAQQAQQGDVGNGQPPSVYPPQPQWGGGGINRTQPVGDPYQLGQGQGQRGGVYDHLQSGQPRPYGQPQQPQQQPQRQGQVSPVPGGGLYPGSLPQSGQPNQPQTQTNPGISQAVANSIQNGYTDIEGAKGYFQKGQYLDQLTGFNTNGMGGDERGANTLKNVMGQIFSNYDVTQPGALQRVLQDPKLREALPNASIVEHENQDLFDPDGPSGPMQPVDVIRGAVAGGSGNAWAWQPQDEQGMGAGPGGPSQQAYLSGMPGQGVPQAGSPQDPTGMPDVNNENSAMQFLQWLMQQQQQGQFGSQAQGMV